MKSVLLPATASLLVAIMVSANGEQEVTRGQLRMTSGNIAKTPSGFMTVTEPKVRAQLRTGNHEKARLQFRYRGQTKSTEPLASGKVVQQIGIKLRTKNTCNVLYVMWQVDTEESVNISVKRNPGQSTHQECGASGYHPIASVSLKELGVSAADEKAHSLEAKIEGVDGDFQLTVKVDDKEAWKGKIGAPLLAGIEGPVGIRTDNGSFIFKFFVE